MNPWGRSRAGALVLALLAAAAATEQAEARSRDELPKSLQEGQRVSVKGRLSPDGKLLARKIEIRKEQDDDEELRGDLDAVDPGARTVSILGYTVQVTSETEFSREPDEAASFEELRAGLRVKVDGYRRGDGAFHADKIKIRRNQQYREQRIVGPIETRWPFDGGTARLRVVGLEVLIDEATELAGAGGRARPIVRRRLGVVDDDDLQFTGRGRLSDRVAMAGEVRLRGEHFDNADLDDAVDDDELVPELFGIVGFAFDFDSVFFYTEAAAEREFFIESEDAFAEGKDDVRIGETYFELRRLPVPRVSLAIGRQKFNEEREWFYNQKNLDAVRLLADFTSVTLEASVSRDIFDESRNERDQDKTNLILQMRYVHSDALEVESYFIDRDDSTELEDSPRILGLRLIGEPGRHIEYWADLAHDAGRRGMFDPPTGRTIVRDVSAEALDVGLTYRPRIALDPTFTVSYAYGSGEVGPDLPDDLVEREAALDALAGTDDGTFRQSGLHRNRGKFNGVVSFRYYGEVLDPELTNMSILTAGIGLRPTHAFSFDLVYHRYRQDEASSRLRSVDIDGDPEGTDTDLGDALDLILGYEPGRRFELRLTAGVFEPGDAFISSLETATVVRLQSKFRF